MKRYLLLELIHFFSMLGSDMLEHKILADKHLGAELVAPPIQQTALGICTADLQWVRQLQQGQQQS